MTDAEADAQKARVNRYLEKWMPAGFGWWKIDVEWDRGHHGDCDTCERAAKCSVHWEYRMATITFYLQQLVEMKEDELEEVVVHELAHLLVSPIEDFSNAENRQMTEFTVTTVARTLIWTHLHVKPDSEA